ncbi:hypothetical protein D3OALGB2SA_5336 [Olavius algarvensis associated proteobacterium Delta 3]|nr:hypothetical protein D3OALGB2SA_5336 [Olavius algarvensis associated proteobacterium Delta 3]
MKRDDVACSALEYICDCGYRSGFKTSDRAEACLPQAWVKAKADEKAEHTWE